MKKILVISTCLFISFVSKGQTDTSSVEQYCQLIASQRILSNKVTIDVDFGDEKSFWRHTRLKTDGGKVKKFNTIIDAMNYMGKAGWTFINAYPVRIGDSEIFHFAFKKQFSKADVQN